MDTWYLITSGHSNIHVLVLKRKETSFKLLRFCLLVINITLIFSVFKTIPFSHGGNLRIIVNFFQECSIQIVGRMLVSSAYKSTADIVSCSDKGKSLMKSK